MYTFFGLEASPRRWRIKAGAFFFFLSGSVCCCAFVGTLLDKLILAGCCAVFIAAVRSIRRVPEPFAHHLS